MAVSKLPSSTLVSSETTRLQVPVQGMHCTGCAHAIEVTLDLTEGVSEVSVSYPLARADFSYDPHQISLGQIHELVRDLGYSVPAESARFGVQGMTCTGCSDGIQKNLSRIPGVVSASVSLPQEEAVVEFLSSAVTPEELHIKVKELGYQPVVTAAPSEAVTTEQPAPPPDRRKAKLITAIACSVSIFFLNMILPLVWSVPALFQEWAGLGLATILQVWVGAEFHQRAWKSLRSGLWGMDMLVSLGSNVAFLTGLCVLLLNLDRNLFPLFFESAAFIITFIYLGRYLEARTRRQTGDAIRGLMSLQPATAQRVRGSDVTEVSMAEVNVGDTLLVRAGDTVPVDGTVSTGESTVDESVLTGESLPVYKQSGNEVWGGTSNLEGAFQMSARAVGQETAVARIAGTVENALLSRAPVQSLADSVASVFVPIILALAVGTALIWGLWGAARFYPDASVLSISLLFATSVLLISCPCALGLATPTAMIAGTAMAARRGILVKNAAALQELAAVDVLVFDKTGTVTEGQPQVQKVVVSPAGGLTSQEMLGVAASALQGSAHPIGQAIVEAATEQGLAIEKAEEFQSQTGKGVRALVAGREVLVGSPAFLHERGLDLRDWQSQLEASQTGGQNLTLVASDKSVWGYFTIADALKTDAAEFVRSARGTGISLRMLSGDNQAAATAVALELGLDPGSEVTSQMLPEEKAQTIADLQAKGQKVCMVGDGVNDAPALAQADVGMAMTSGHNLALETADVGVLSQDLQRIPQSLALGQRVMRIVKQNLFWAFFYNVAAIPLAAGLFVPFWGPAVKLNPAVAAGAMALSSLFVVHNSLRIYRTRKV